MLKILPEGQFKGKIATLLEESKDRLFEVKTIIEKTEKQIPPIERIDAAKLRLKLKV